MTTEHVFPQAVQAGDVAQSTGGMTLRDYFAAQAMPRLLELWHDDLKRSDEGFSGLNIVGNEGGLPDGIADEAYAMADAMLRARQQSTTTA